MAKGLAQHPNLTDNQFTALCQLLKLESLTPSARGQIVFELAERENLTQNQSAMLLKLLETLNLSHHSQNQIVESLLTKPNLSDSQLTRLFILLRPFEQLTARQFNIILSLAKAKNFPSQQKLFFLPLLKKESSSIFQESEKSQLADSLINCAIPFLPQNAVLICFTELLTNFDGKLLAFNDSLREDKNAYYYLKILTHWFLNDPEGFQVQLKEAGASMPLPTLSDFIQFIYPELIRQSTLCMLDKDVLYITSKAQVKTITIKDNPFLIKAKSLAIPTSIIEPTPPIEKIALEDAFSKMVIDDQTKINSPFLLAAWHGDIKKIEIFPHLINETEHERTALHWACLGRHINVVKCLIEKDIDLDKQDKNNNTALHLALQKKSTSIAKELIKKGASIHLKNDDDLNAWQLILKQHHDLIKCCLEKANAIDNLHLYKCILGYGKPTLKKKILVAVQQYKADYSKENKKANQGLLDTLTCQLLGIEKLDYDMHYYSEQLDNKKNLTIYPQRTASSRKAYFRGQLISVATSSSNSIFKKSLNGWNPRDFLSARIRFLLKTLINLDKTTQKECTLPASKDFIQQKLIQEIHIETLALQAVMIREGLHEKETQDPDFYHHCKALHLSQLQKVIANLKEKEEFSYPAGSTTHTLYVSFQRQGEYIHIRADNLGSGKDFHEQRSSPGKANSVVAKRLAIVPSSFIQSEHIKAYLDCLMTSAFSKKDEKLNKIYQYFKEPVSAAPDWWPSKKAPTGNCLVKNHNVGLLHRFYLDKEKRLSQKEHHRLYDWVREKERRYLTKKHR